MTPYSPGDVRSQPVRIRQPFYRKRRLDFDRKVKIRGEVGPAHVEAITRPLTRYPDATTRVVVRWAGVLPRLTLIEVDGEKMIVLGMCPMTPRIHVAHLFCIKKAAPAARPIRRGETPRA